MLLNATIAKLEALGLGAMAAGLADQLERPGPESELSFEDRLGLLADREADARDARRLANRLKAAKLRYPAAVEDIDFRTPRGLDRGVIASLAGAGWVTPGPQRVDHRGDRLRQELRRLRHGQCRPPPGPHRPLRAGPAAVGRTGPGPS